MLFRFQARGKAEGLSSTVTMVTNEISLELCNVFHTGQVSQVSHPARCML